MFVAAWYAALYTETSSKTMSPYIVPHTMRRQKYYLRLRPIRFAPFTGVVSHVCQSRLSVTLSTKSTKFGSRYLVDRLSEEYEIRRIGSLVLIVGRTSVTRLVNFCPWSPPGAPQY